MSSVGMTGLRGKDRPGKWYLVSEEDAVADMTCNHPSV